MELPLTPLDLLARARRLFTDREGVDRRRRALDLRRARGALRPAGPRPAARRSACSPATSWRGCAATPTSCSRRTTACSWPAACSSRSTSGWRPPSCARSSTTAARSCCSGTPTSPTPATRCRTVVLGDEHEALLADAAGDAAGHPARRRARARRALLHVGLHRHAQGRAAQPPRPLPPRRAQRARRWGSPATTCSSTRSRCSTSTAGARRTSSPASAACTCCSPASTPARSCASSRRTASPGCSSCPRWRGSCSTTRRWRDARPVERAPDLHRRVGVEPRAARRGRGAPSAAR